MQKKKNGTAQVSSRGVCGAGGGGDSGFGEEMKMVFLSVPQWGRSCREEERSCGPGVE